MVKKCVRVRSPWILLLGLLSACDDAPSSASVSDGGADAPFDAPATASCPPPDGRKLTGLVEIPIAGVAFHLGTSILDLGTGQIRFADDGGLAGSFTFVYSQEAGCIDLSHTPEPGWIVTPNGARCLRADYERGVLRCVLLDRWVEIKLPDRIVTGNSTQFRTLVDSFRWLPMQVPSLAEVEATKGAWCEPSRTPQQRRPSRERFVDNDRKFAFEPPLGTVLDVTATGIVDSATGLKRADFQSEGDLPELLRQCRLTWQSPLAQPQVNSHGVRYHILPNIDTAREGVVAWVLFIPGESAAVTFRAHRMEHALLKAIADSFEWLK